MSNNLPCEEKELISRVATGDERAFKLLFDCYWSQVYVHVLSYLKRADRAEDITQDIFFSIWVNKHKLSEIIQFEHYLRVVTRHRTISELRKRLPDTQNLSSEELDERTISFKDTCLPDQQLEHKQANEIMHHAIDLLPPRRKQVFQMSRMAGLTHAEIASRLNISKITVNEHIGEALIFLRTYLANHSDMVLPGYFLIYLLS